MQDKGGMVPELAPAINQPRSMEYLGGQPDSRHRPTPAPSVGRRTGGASSLVPKYVEGYRKGIIYGCCDPARPGADSHQNADFRKRHVGANGNTNALVSPPAQTGDRDGRLRSPTPPVCVRECTTSSSSEQVPNESLPETSRPGFEGEPIIIPGPALVLPTLSIRTRRRATRRFSSSPGRPSRRAVHSPTHPPGPH